MALYKGVSFMELFKTALIVFAIVSGVNFILYGIDKLKAKLGAWRIPEVVLLTFSILGGGLGGTLAMLLFRHKTRHWYFTVINVLGTLVQLGALGYIFFTFV